MTSPSMPISAAGSQGYQSMLARLNQAAGSTMGSAPAAPPVGGPVAIPPAIVMQAQPQVVLPAGNAFLDGVTGAYQSLVGKLSDLVKRLVNWVKPTQPPAEKPAEKPTEKPAEKPAPAPPAASTYTVQKGDSLSAIAKRTLGDSNRWREIYDLNRDQIGANPNLIHPGQTLKLPGGANPAPPAAPPASPAPKPPAPKPPAPAAGSYTVQPGDSLSAIAGRTLGDSNRWREIYDLNRDQIGANPNQIRAGMTLRLPGGAKPAPNPGPYPSNGKWENPVPGRLTSPYGMRKHPISGQHKLHTGMDIGAASGTPVKVVQGGRVSFAGWNGGYGNYVVVDHGNGLQTAYAHLSSINVRKGQSVGARDVVGKVGSTGNSTGPHLHFEVKRNGNFVDPRGMLA